MKRYREFGIEKCYAYGKWFAERYKDNPYVIYFVGGDAVPEPELAAMAKGIQEVYNGKAIVAVDSRQTTSSLEVLAGLYTPVSHALQLNLDELSEGQISAEWYDPCTSEYKPAENIPKNERGKVTLISPAKTSCG